MRCGGCGSKVGATILDRVLARLAPLRRDDVVVGLDAPDDAAVEEVPPGKVVVQTVDAFRALVDDPYLFGRITANHCLSDLYAMGAEPRSALAIVTVPYGSEAKTEALLDDLLAGAVAELNAAGAALVGGHTTEGAELTLGFAVSGVAERQALMRKGGMRPGDRLLLTKPVGTGTLFAADMRRKAKARWIDRRHPDDAPDEPGSVRGGAPARGHGLHGRDRFRGARPSRGDDQGLRSRRAPRARRDPDPRRGARHGRGRAAQLPATAQRAAAPRRRQRGGGRASTRGSRSSSTRRRPAGCWRACRDRSAEACLADLRALGYERAAIVGVVEPRSERDAPIHIGM